MQYASHTLTLAALLTAGQAIHAQVSAAMGADVPELVRLLEQRKTDFISIDDRIIPIDMQNKNLQGAQLSNVDLSNANFTGADLSNAHVSGARLAFTNFRQANLTNANFKDTDLSAVLTFNQATLTNGNFTNTRSGSDFPVLFHSANVTNANFTNANFPRANFSGSNLTNTNFTGATMSANFDRANLTNTNFSNAQLARSTFFDCTGFNATISNNKTDFSEVLGLADEQKAYARSKGALNVPD
jgi:uncharacterized protein YjbI with pentapeptide repeats